MVSINDINDINDESKIESLVDLIVNHFYDNLPPKNIKHRQIMIIIYMLLEHEICGMDYAMQDNFLNQNIFLDKLLNAFCKKEEIVFKIVDAFIIAIVVGLVIYKCLKYKSWKKYNIIEIISVFLSFLSYFIFEFFVFKVTFSFIAIGISILFLFPYLYSIFWEYKEINRIYE